MTPAKAFWLRLWLWVRTVVPRPVHLRYVAPAKRKTEGRVW